jgi:hypothetical protein
VRTALIALILIPGFAVAWGPHTEITQAAQSVLPNRATLARRFGPHWNRLATDYVWTPDWQEAVRPDHYAEDYLLFPQYPSHLSHMHPIVRRTYRPFFQRALQALRTEEPADAARWLGSLLHFVQDSGSPPHTTGIGGELHGRMERWVDESRITLGDYRPRILGTTDEQAELGFLERMESLNAFARARAIRLRPLVEKLDRRVNQPLELECALECARVSADLLHSLFALAAQPGDASATLEGKVVCSAPTGYARVPAKVMLARTGYSTTTGPDGRYRLRNLPAGKYTVWFMATGYEAKAIANVELKAKTITLLSPEMAVDPVPGNLVRNAQMAVEWVKPGQPDCWVRDPVRAGRWASAVMRIPIKQTCEVRIVCRPGKSVPVSVRWRSNPASTAGSSEVGLKVGRTAEVTPSALLPFEKEFLFLELLIAGKEPLGELIEHAAVRFKPRM